ncbi:hypothetical protein CDD83_3654 [Cordyceps sp. RAO-2017]|nr:hypothetical protein CDD83_3654 [Cordyceps sp. RAO-2017]
MDDAGGPCAEISDALYRASVLRLPSDRSEDQVELELLAKAHGLGIRASLPSVSYRRRAASVALSQSSASTEQEQLFEAASDGGSASTYLTPHSSIIGPPSPDVSAGAGAPVGAGAGQQQQPQQQHQHQQRNWSFSPYEKYLVAQADAAVDSAKSVKSGKSTATADSSGHSILSVTTKRTAFAGLKDRMLLRRKPTRTFEPNLSCLSCRTSFSTPALLHSLSCGHTHCADCLRLKIDEASAQEGKMPPRCCAALPASTVQRLLEPAAQEAFLRAVVQFSTPWESRMFCPSASCGEFIPRRRHVDPKAPFAASCRLCHTRICTLAGPWSSGRPG